MDNRRISIAIPTWNRFEQTIASFIEVYADERIGEIIVTDDASDLNIFHELREVCDRLPKVKLLRNAINQDCYRNKMTALSFAKYPFCILLDSDNSIGRDYLDKLYEFDYWESDCIYTPSFARPTFDFRRYAGLTITRSNVSQYISLPMLETCLNAANYFVNKDTWLKAFDDNTDPVTSDSIFIVYNHLKDGGKLKIVEGLEYEHKVHDGSHYKNNVHRTPRNFHQTILNNLRNLR